MPTTTIRERVATEISTLAPRLETELVDALVEREVEKRTKALVQVIDKLTKEEADLKKLGADNVSYDDAGKKVSESFSKKRIDERGKANGRIQKLTNAINKALDKNDYSDLYNFASGKDPESSGAGDSEDSGS